MSRPPLQIRPLDHPVICDICGRRRNRGNHQKCSKQRQREGTFAKEAR